MTGIERHLWPEEPLTVTVGPDETALLGDLARGSVRHAALDRMERIAAGNLAAVGFAEIDPVDPGERWLAITDAGQRAWQRAVFHRFVLALLEICATHEGWANGQPTPNQKQTK